LVAGPSRKLVALMATAEELATELYAIRSEIASLKLREQDVEDRLAAEMPEKRLEIPEIGVFERRTAVSRKQWQHDDLRREVIKHTERIVTEDGEIESEAEAQVRTLFECMAPSYWRVGALKSLGIDPSDYCETAWGRQTVQFIGELDR
jgi:hypothetical protein